MKITCSPMLLALSGLGLLASAPAALAAVRAEDIGFTDAQILSVLERGPIRTTAPGISFGSPVAFGLDWGEIGVGLGGTYESDNAIGKDVDGSLAFAIGLGDANNSVGLEISAGINSLASQNGQDEFGSEGAFGAKLHTTLPYRSAFAVGIENVGRFGKDTKQTESSGYVVVTKYFDLRPKAPFTYPIALNLGLGNGRFLREVRPEDTVNVFGSVELLMNRRTSIAADWTGRDLNIGLSFVPFVKLPFVASIGGVNLTGQNDHNPALAVSIGYLFRF